MIYPNIECYFLAQWMLTVFVPRLTGAQITLTNAISAAALAQTSISDQEWKDFCRIAQWRNPYYIVYRDYQNSLPVDLNVGLIHYYDMEGSSTDQVGSINGTDSNISYSSSYGKIGQGARANSGSSYIELGSTSDFSFIPNTGVFSFNGWVYMPSNTSLVIPFGCTASGSSKGPLVQLNNSDYTRVTMYNGSGSATSFGSILVANLYLTAGWKMITITGDGSALKLYLNGVLVGQSGIFTLSSGNTTNPLRLFQVPSYSGSSGAYIDEVGFWDRALNVTEIFTLFNSGAGLTYPFP